MKYYDVTIPISMDTPVWEGDKSVIISRESLISEGADYNVSHLELGAHTGTHVDAPYHVFGSGKTLDQIPLEHFIGKAQVLEIPDHVDRITGKILNNFNIEKGIHALLFKTSNSKLWKKEPCRFQKDYVALDASAAEQLVLKGIKLTGIDWFSISPMDDLVTPHKILLGASILIVENLDLSDVAQGIYTLYCLPLKVVGTDGAPVRAILACEG